MDRDQFLAIVHAYIAKDPEAAAVIHHAVQAGLRKSLEEALERAADMEVALAACASARFKGYQGLMLEKLTKWKGRTSQRWDWLTDKLTASESEGKK